MTQFFCLYHCLRGCGHTSDPPLDRNPHQKVKKPGRTSETQKKHQARLTEGRLIEDFVVPQIKSTFLINSGASCRGEALPLFSSFLLTSLLFDGKKHRIKGSFTHARAAKRENRAKVTLVWIWWSERSSRRAQASFTAWWFNLSEVWQDYSAARWRRAESSCGQCTPLLWGIILLPRRIKTRAGVLWVESLTVEAEPACDFKVMRTLF